MKRSRRNKKARKKMNPWLFLLILVVCFAAATGASYYYLRDIFAFDSSFIADIEARQDRNRDQDRKTGSRLYGIGKQEPDSGSSVVLRKDTLLVVAEDIIRKYMKSYDVRLLDLYMDKEGVIYIDLGDELKKNFMGDALEEARIIAGLYTGIKSTIPGFTALKILIEGREVESFGGHIDISRPIGEEIAKNIW